MLEKGRTQGPGKEAGPGSLGEIAGAGQALTAGSRIGWRRALWKSLEISHGYRLGFLQLALRVYNLHLWIQPRH